MNVYRRAANEAWKALIWVAGAPTPGDSPAWRSIRARIFDACIAIWALIFLLWLFELSERGFF